ncbi:hypothetical protein RFI_16385 [Reticulomyxa filosa]|uniref:Uncharacterized protein n=1 Tax=Reticulomyxa filosa TaxID=46433 RepID=X6N3G8_RETFI|nr:hypothetical protein RFI_16385 [Reticulomyxa filosa]|eukprot:ETO20825.1 hypothetical protein RFI_16385 [Reticulomyxa filosa]
MEQKSAGGAFGDSSDKSWLNEDKDPKSKEVNNNRINDEMKNDESTEKIVLSLRVSGCYGLRASVPQCVNLNKTLKRDFDGKKDEEYAKKDCFLVELAQ